MGQEGGVMDHLRRTLSLSKKKKQGGDTGSPSSPGYSSASKPLQWQEDERKVREGTCSFQVKYLGCIEVFESRGMEVCEDAAKLLRSQNRSKHQRVVLYVSGDALRVVDEISKGLIVDQTIEKVSFCAPDRNHDKGFAYICRDGTTRRWLCHGFLALKESGERLSHAVGCAFSVCLERKQKRERDAVQVTYTDDRTVFTRVGSFRQTPLIERMIDPQAAIVAEPVTTATSLDNNRKPPAVDPAAARERPQMTSDAFARIGSFRDFPKLAGSTSPFKRQLSLRLSTQVQGSEGSDGELQRGLAQTGNPLPRITSVSEPSGSFIGRPSTADSAGQTSAVFDPISALCQQMTSELTFMTAGEDAAAARSRALPDSVPTSQTFFAVASKEPSYPASLATTLGRRMASESTSLSATAVWHDASVASQGSTSNCLNGMTRQRAAASIRPGSSAPLLLTSSSLVQPSGCQAASASANGSSSNAGDLSNAANIERDPFDAAWALRAAASTATNPFLPKRDQGSGVLGQRGFEHQPYAFEMRL